MLRRRLLAGVALLALLVECALLLLAHEAHASRTHIRVKLSAQNAIVQVFVECRLAYVFRGERVSHETVDLGWLKKEDTLTFQVRSRKHVASYALAYERGSEAIALTERGSLGQLVQIPESRAVFQDSWSVGGRRLGQFGCQEDAAHLAFASPTASNWHEPSAKRYELVTSLADVVPWVLASLGGLGLIFVALAGRIDGVRSKQRTAIQVLLALGELAVAVLASIATVDSRLVFVLCVAAGACSLLAVVLWLLKSDVHHSTAPRPKNDPPGDGDARRVEGGEGATTAGGI